MADTAERRPAPEGGITEDRAALMIEQAMQAALKSHEQHLMLHMDKQFALLQQTFASAFPGGDPHGHRLAHEKAIRDATGWDRLKADLVSKFLTAGLWVAAGWLALAAWEAFKHEVRK